MTLGDKILTGVAGATLLGGAALFSGESESDPLPAYIPQETHEAPSAAPISQSVEVKTKAKISSCHSGYSGCLNPNASDYDCAGGSGNGPYYTGRVEVYGSDPFDLDRDGDGVGCDK